MISETQNETYVAMKKLGKEVQRWTVKSAFYGKSIYALITILFVKYLFDQDKIVERRKHLFQHFKDKCLEKEGWKFVAKGIGLTNIRSKERLSNYLLGVDYTSLDGDFKKILEVVADISFQNADERQMNRKYLLEVLYTMVDQQRKNTVPMCTKGYTGKFMSLLLQADDSMSVYDPCVGLGLSLFEAAFQKNVEIFAQEADTRTAANFEMLAILIGVRPVVIRCANTIESPLTEALQSRLGKSVKFDRIICEPPVTIDTVCDQYSPEYFVQFPDKEKRMKNDPWIMVRHIIASLKQDGRAVVLLPMPMLTRNTQSMQQFRRLMVENAYIDSILELPIGTMADSSVKVSVMILQKNTSNSIFMMDLSNGMWEQYVEKVQKPDTGVNELAQIAIDHKTIAGISRMVPTEEIKEGRYQLAVAGYVKGNMSPESFPKSSKELMSQLNELQSTYKKLCEEFESVKEYVV